MSPLSSVLCYFLLPSSALIVVPLLVGCVIPATCQPCDITQVPSFSYSLNASLASTIEVVHIFTAEGNNSVAWGLTPDNSTLTFTVNSTAASYYKGSNIHIPYFDCIDCYLGCNWSSEIVSAKGELAFVRRVLRKDVELFPCSAASSLSPPNWSVLNILPTVASWLIAMMHLVHPCVAQDYSPYCPDTSNNLVLFVPANVRVVCIDTSCYCNSYAGWEGPFCNQTGNISSSAPVVAWNQSVPSDLVTFTNVNETGECVSSTPVVRKPVIYIYPKMKIDVVATVRLANNLQSEFAFFYPEPNRSTNKNASWHMQADVDGTLIQHHFNTQVSYLFWEGKGTIPSSWLDRSSCSSIQSEEVGRFLDDVLKSKGLNVKERTDMITYWLPHMQKHKFVTLGFIEMEKISSLEIEPIPDLTIRVYMLFRGSEKKYNMCKGLDDQSKGEHLLNRRENQNLVVVEWGGSELP